MVELGTAVCVWASLFFALLIGVFSADRRDLPLDHEMCSDNWVDPGDMLSADFSTVRCMHVLKYDVLFVVRVPLIACNTN